MLTRWRWGGDGLLQERSKVAGPFEQFRAALKTKPGEDWENESRPLNPQCVFEWDSARGVIEWNFLTDLK